MDTDDIQAHLDEMALMHEQLSRMGVTLHDDYSSMILMSLPESYTLHLETLANAASSSRNPLTAHTFITKAINLYEKHQLCTRRDTKLGSKDAAFQTHDSKNKGKKGGRNRKRTSSVLTVMKRDTLATTATGLAATRRDRARVPRGTDINPRRGQPTQ